MLRRTIIRILIFCLTVWVAITVNFIIVRATPVDPIAGILGRMASKGQSVQGGAEIVAFYRDTFALDEPWPVQYFMYLRQLLSGNLGYSLAYFPATVGDVLLHAIPWSLGLLLTAVSIAFVVGNLLGALGSWRRAPLVLRGLIYLSMTISEVPFYLLALILLYLFAFMWPILPTGGSFTVGSTRDFSLATAIDFIRHAILPVGSIALGLVGFWALSMRGVMTTVLDEDYLMYGRVKGLRERTLFLHYGVRNAILPQVTALAIDMGQLISGQVLVEAIFNYPGVGTVLFNALRTSDYFVIQGVVLFIIVSVSLAMLVVDLVYPLIDPRITAGEAGR